MRSSYFFKVAILTLLVIITIVSVYNINTQNKVEIKNYYDGQTIVKEAYYALNEIPKSVQLINFAALKKSERQNDKKEIVQLPYHSERPLSGGLDNPQPYFKTGSIEKGADVVIGIPTVRRVGASYLEETLNSFFTNLNPNNDYNIKFVVFVAETDEVYVKERIEQLSKDFSSQVESNLLEIIAPQPEFYPNWNQSLLFPDVFGDPPSRVKWRSKENLDQIYLMMYAYNLHSDYYLMMEDDVITKRGYVDDMMEFAYENENKDYFYLSYCQLGSIGKLFKRKTLPHFCGFIHTFWNRKPLDWLQWSFAANEVCSYDEHCEVCNKKLRSRIVERRPAIFQHMGKVSSLEGKEQLLVDDSFR